MPPEDLNPKFKVGTLNLETFESAELWCFSDSELLSLGGSYSRTHIDGHQ